MSSPSTGTPTRSSSRWTASSTRTRRRARFPPGSAWPFDLPFFIILNFAVGGNWPGPPDANTVFPQDYRIDYVRVYSLPATPPASLVWAPTPPTNVARLLAVVVPDQRLMAGPRLSTFGAAVTGYLVQRATDAAFTQNVAQLEHRGRRRPTRQLGAGRRPLLLPGLRRERQRDLGSLRRRSRRGAGHARNLQAAQHFVARLRRDRAPTRSSPGSWSADRTPRPSSIRASGPALAASPFNVPGTLPDPETPALSAEATVLASNAGWGGNSVDRRCRRGAGFGALPGPIASSNDAALLMTLGAGRLHGSRLRGQRRHGRLAPGSLRRAVARPLRGRPAAETGAHA